MVYMVYPKQLMIQSTKISETGPRAPLHDLNSATIYTIYTIYTIQNHTL